MRVQKFSIFITILLLVIATGCEFSTNTQVKDQQKVFTVTNDVADRIVEYNSSAKSNEVNASADATDYLELDFRIKSPTVNGTKTEASHLYLHDDKVYAGYKIIGAEYGGGIDIIDVDDEARGETAYSFQGNHFDVQEIVYDPVEDALYVAGAQERRNEGDPKSWLLKVDPDNANIKESVALSGNVAKSVDANDDYIYAVSDFDDIYRFNKDLGSEGEISVGGGTEFRSVGARFQNHVFTLDLNGNVGRVNPNFNQFKIKAQLAEQPFKTHLGIARLNYFHDDPNKVLVALNQHGLAILNPQSGKNEWSGEKTGKYYVSATGLRISATEAYVFAAASGVNGDNDNRQYIDIFDVGPGFQSPAEDLIASLDLSTFDGLTDAPINHVIATESKLYVAKGKDGILIFNINDFDDLVNN